MAATLDEGGIVRRSAESIAVKDRLRADSQFVGQLLRVGIVMSQSLRQGRKVFFMGNGGSAADAQQYHDRTYTV